MIALSDYLRWTFKKNLMEFFVGMDYYLYYFTVAVLLLVHSHMFFQMFHDHLTLSHDLIT